MEERKVVISVDDLRYKIKEVTDNYRDEISEILDNAEDYIRVAHVLNVEEEDNPKFKVGDVLTGKESNGYYVTTNESVLLVTNIVDSDEIKVKVMDHKELFHEIGQEFNVDPKYFKLITDIL